MLYAGEQAESAIAWGTRALELAERLDEPEVVSHALTNLGTAEWLEGSAEGRAKLERSFELAVATGLEEGAARAITLLGWCALLTRTYDPAAGYVQRGLDYCDERDLRNWRPVLLLARARLELDAGRWDDALTTAESALAEATSTERALALAIVGLVRARRGDPDVWPALDEALALAPAGELWRAVTVAVARAEAAWLEGRNDAAVEETQAAFALALQRRAGWASGELAAWRRRAGFREPTPAGVAGPHALELAGDPDGAAARWDALGCPYEAALALADGGSEQPLRTALQALQRLGARPAAAIVARRLRELGVRDLPRGPRRSTRMNAAGLTVREVEVLGLVCEGLSNADIATRLFLSVRTVDHHLSASFAKLGVSSRGEAAAAAARLGIGGKSG